MKKKNQTKISIRINEPMKSIKNKSYQGEMMENGWMKKKNYP